VHFREKPATLAELAKFPELELLAEFRVVDQAISRLILERAPLQPRETTQYRWNFRPRGGFFLDLISNDGCFHTGPISPQEMV
jgi:hypothetical protein